MNIISLAGQKGGTGKSTVCWILANAALAQGRRVALVDCDIQLSTANYVQKALDQHPDLADSLLLGEYYGEEVTELATLLREIEAKGADLCVIDTPGRAISLARIIMQVSDCVVITGQPVEQTMVSLQDTLELLEAARSDCREAGIREPVGGLLLNNYDASRHNTRKIKAAIVGMAQSPHMLPFFMPFRTSFMSMGNGSVLFKDLMACKPAEHFLADALKKDLAESISVLSSIERLIAETKGIAKEKEA